MWKTFCSSSGITYVIYSSGEIISARPLAPRYIIGTWFTINPGGDREIVIGGNTRVQIYNDETLEVI